MINENIGEQQSQDTAEQGTSNTTHSAIINGGEQSNSASQSETNTSQSEVNTSQISEVNTSQSIAMTSATTNIKPKLPKLTLPKSKGDVTKWNTF